MKVYIDTNILIDLVCRREPFAEQAQKLFALGYIGKLSLITSALSFVLSGPCRALGKIMKMPRKAKAQ